MSSKTDQLENGATTMPSLENLLNPTHTTRMELQKELIALYAKGRLQWCKKHRFRDKSQRLSQKRAPSSFEYPAFRRTSGQKQFNMQSGLKTEHLPAHYARRMRKLRMKP